ncbi:MAG: type II toxin-antitoxin system VapC family toxin [Thermodesulfobacteriota bacterium]
MNVVDSSGWLEYFADAPNAGHFAKPLQAKATLVVPTICLFEVFKVVLRERGEDAALQAAALMRQGMVVDLDSPLAIWAAQNSLTYKLPMADSIILTTAQAHQAAIWTQDTHFQGLPNVHYFPKR